MEKEEVVLAISLRGKLFMNFVRLEVASFLAHFRVRQKNCNKFVKKKFFQLYHHQVLPPHSPPPSPPSSLHALDAILNGNRLGRK